MKKLLLLSIYVLPIVASAQKKITLSGNIKDMKSGEALIGATIYVTNEKRGTTSNSYGFYSISAKKADSLGLIISYQGYQPRIVIISGRTSQSIDYNLEEKSTSLKEVVVSMGRNNNNVSKARMSVINIPMKQIKTLRQKLAQYNPFVEPVFIIPGQFKDAIGVFGAYAVSDSVLFVYPE